MNHGRIACRPKSKQSMMRVPRGKTGPRLQNNLNNLAHAKHSVFYLVKGTLNSNFLNLTIKREKIGV